MSDGLAVAIVGAIAVMVTAIFAYLGTRRGNGNGHAKKADAANPATVRLTSAQAEEIMQQVYARLLDETQEERDRLKQELDAEREARRGLAARVAALESELNAAKSREEKLLNTIAEQQRKIESQAQEIITLRQNKAQ